MALRPSQPGGIVGACARSGPWLTGGAGASYRRICVCSRKCLPGERVVLVRALPTVAPAPAVPPAPAGSLTAPGRSLSLAGARILAGQLRDAAARRHALAIAQVGHSRACPFDLQALIPVPDAMLPRGPDDPAALAWLWTHWGTTQTLRHVAEDAAAGAARQTRAAPGEAVWVLTFWSADWTPWRALAQLSAGWPTLRFDARPIYDA